MVRLKKADAVRCSVRRNAEQLWVQHAARSTKRGEKFDKHSLANVCHGFAFIQSCHQRNSCSPPTNRSITHHVRVAPRNVVQRYFGAAHITPFQDHLAPRAHVTGPALHHFALTNWCSDLCSLDMACERTQRGHRNEQRAHKSNRARKRAPVRNGVKAHCTAKGAKRARAPQDVAVACTIIPRRR